MKKAIFLGGTQGSGKTTGATFITNQLADGQWNFEIIKYADPLYEITRIVDRFFCRLVGRDPEAKNGKLMQKLGTDIGRELYGEDVWVNEAKKRADAVAEEAKACDQSHVVIFEDVRRENELMLKELFREAGYDVVSILFEAPLDVRKARAESFRPDTSHKSESELETLRDRFDYIIETSGDIALKESKLKEILKSIGIEFNPRSLLEDSVKIFNDCLEAWEETTQCGANFEWYYDAGGRKRLRIRDCAPVKALPADRAAIAVTEVQKTMEALDAAQ